MPLLKTFGGNTKVKRPSISHLCSAVPKARMPSASPLIVLVATKQVIDRRRCLRGHHCPRGQRCEQDLITTCFSFTYLFIAPSETSRTSNTSSGMKIRLRGCTAAMKVLWSAYYVWRRVSSLRKPDCSALETERQSPRFVTMFQAPTATRCSARRPCEHVAQTS